MMTERIELSPKEPWVELRTTPEDWRDADPHLLETMLGQMHLIRAFEETVLQLAGEGLVHGPAHSSIGQEGGAVGSIVGLRATDAVNGSHRGHHQFLAKAIGYVTPDGLDCTNLVTEPIQTVLQRTLAEILGLAQGYCSGRGGSMHLQWKEAGALGTNAIVGGGVPLGAGNAWAQQHSGTSDLTVSYFGDGAVNIGSVLETMNLTAAWDIPLSSSLRTIFTPCQPTFQKSPQKNGCLVVALVSESPAGVSMEWIRWPFTLRCKKLRRTRVRVTDRPLLRRRCTDFSTKMAPSRVARLGIDPRTRKRSGAGETR
jgi:hypothetical protein